MLRSVGQMVLRKALVRPREEQLPPARLSRADETRAGLVRSIAALSKAPEQMKPWTGTGMRKGEHTALYEELKAQPILVASLKVDSKSTESVVTLRNRHAALVRWQRAGKGAYAEAENSGIHGEVSNLLPPASTTRAWKRFESDHFAGSSRDYTAQDLFWWCEVMDGKRLKWTEYDELYKEGRVRVPPSMVRLKLYREEADAWKKLATDGLVPLGAPPRVRAHPHPTCAPGLQ